MASVTATQTRALRDPHTGRTYQITKGQTYKTTSKLYKIFHRKSDAIFVPAGRRSYGGGQTWTAAELDLITDLYLEHVRPADEHDARATILKEFRRVFNTHSDDAVELTVRRIIRLDTAYPSEGMLGAHVGYWQILDSKCPGRFVPPTL